jgi:hypothetical protein
MLHNLPIGVWLHLSSGDLLHRFEAQLLSDPSFIKRAKSRLNSRATEHDDAEAAAIIQRISRD